MKSDEKKCPDCKEIINRDAKVCRHCGCTFSEDVLAIQREADNKRGRPTESNPRAGAIVGVILLLSLGYCAFRPSTSSTPETPVATTPGQPNLIPQAASQPPAPVVPTSKWSYSESVDQMRGTKTRFAEISSNNEVEFDFPYNGGSTATLQLRHRPQDGLSVLLSVSKGQFICHSFSESTVAVKFDKGKIRHFGCNEPTSGNSDVVFIESEAAFIKALKKSHHLIIEAQFFQAGGRQFEFDTAGLKWR